MHEHVDTRDGQPRPISLLDDLVTARLRSRQLPRCRPTSPRMLNPEKGVFIQSKNKPTLDLAVEPVPGRETTVVLCSTRPRASRC